MHHDGYKCLDYTVYPNESDGSIDFYGENNLNVNSKLHDIYYHLSDEFNELYKCLNVKKMLLMRANCTVATKTNFRSSYHIDLKKSAYLGIGKTAILYLNTNNGGTQIKDGGFVQSIANSIAVFDNTTEHAGVWATDKKLRFVLNLNYLEN